MTPVLAVVDMSSDTGQLFTVAGFCKKETLPCNSSFLAIASMDSPLFISVVVYGRSHVPHTFFRLNTFDQTDDLLRRDAGGRHDDQ